HRVPAELPDADQAATQYEAELRGFFNLGSGQMPRFDLVLLGTGPEGHTASLFPGTRALAEHERVVVADWLGKFLTPRITVTAPVRNSAAVVAFLVSGAEKAQVLKAIFEGPYEPEQLPAQLISPLDGRLVWLLDQAAAQQLAPRAA